MNRLRILAFAFLVVLCSGAFAAPLRPHAIVQPIAPGEAHWTSGFWAERVEVCRTSTIPALWRIMEGTNYSHFLQNFKIATGDAKGRFRGATFNDGELYKLMEASIATLGVTNDPALVAKLDSAIDLISRAQRANGYIHTQVLVRQKTGDKDAAPFQSRNNFEMYNLGHLMTTAALHHRVTGKTNLLNVARKAADFLYRTFNEASPDAARSAVCPSHYMGIVDLYRATGDPRYLRLVRRLFELRNQVTDGGDDNQDRIPFEQQSTALGHAVRANYLYAGAADVFMESGEAKLWKPLDPIWHNVVRQKMYITGGCGALYDGASPYASREQRTISRTHQAYGYEYELPNTTAHNETCANVGNVLWNWRMFLGTGEARFLDVAELALHNSVLSGVSLSGTNFAYVNPLRITDPLPIEMRWGVRRVPFIGSFCCPPNLARTLARSAEYIYAKSERAVWIALYGGSVLNTHVPGVGNVRLTQQTEFPWTGKVRVRVDAAPGGEFSLKLRIPEWSSGQVVRINHQPAGAASNAHGFLDLKRAWKAGDVIDLDMEMQVRLFEANPLVEETTGQVAFKRGPIVYCVESVDLPNGVKPQDVVITPGSEFLARHDQRLLGGVVTLDGMATIRTNAAWQKDLYREVQPADTRQQPIRLIPYSMWDNRGESEMSVWLRRSDP